MITDLERKNIFAELDEGVTELLETLEDFDVNESKDKVLLNIKANLDIIYGIIEDENI